MISSPSRGKYRHPLILITHKITKLTEPLRTITPKYVKENFDAVHVQLTTEESQCLRDLVDKASVFGERYPMEHGGGLFADTPLPEEWDGKKRDVSVIGRVIPPKK